MSFSEKVFRDPVHNYVHVNHKIIYQLINTKEFQRLRRIKQLGTSSFTFMVRNIPDFHIVLAFMKLLGELPNALNKNIIQNK